MILFMNVSITSCLNTSGFPNTRDQGVYGNALALPLGEPFSDDMQRFGEYTAELEIYHNNSLPPPDGTTNV